MSIHHEDRDVTLHHGHVLDVLPTLDAASVNCVVTSPPYFGLRDYGVDGQIGLEPSPAEYVAALVDVFREVRRVLRDDGVVWLNLGDSYSTRKVVRDSSHQPGFHPDRTDHDTIGKTWAQNAADGNARMPASTGVPEKNLIGIPWRVAFALQDDGWTLRNSVVWHKPNAMPESVTDRLSSRYETVFLLSKSRRYWFDLDPVREPQSSVSVARAQRADMRGKPGWAEAYHGNPPGGLARQSDRDTDRGKNPGDVWSIATVPYRGAHFATMPPDLARRCILAGCPDGGTVLDPFTGSGTTGMVARHTGRRFVGIDLNPAYLDLAVERIGEPTLDFGAAP